MKDQPKNEARRELEQPKECGVSKTPIPDRQCQASNDQDRPTAVIEARMFQRLLSVKWGLRIEREPCLRCGGAVKVIASIEDPVVIKNILTHLNEKAASAGTGLLPESRAPSQAGLFDRG